MSEPDYRDVACSYCGRHRVQCSGICEKCQWDNDLGNFVGITGRCPKSRDGQHTPVPGNNIMGPPFMECEYCLKESVSGEGEPHSDARVR